jgi:hypothetical protein
MRTAQKLEMLRSRTLHPLIALILLCAGRLIAQDAALETSAPEVYVDIPGTRISIRIPSGFSLAEGFPGIVRDEYRAAVVTTEIPSPIQEVLAGMSDQELAAEGMTLVRSEKFAVSGIEATLFHARQEDPDGAVRKWLVLFGDEKLTVMLAASVPEILEPEVGKSLEECLLTARWDPNKTVDPYAGMGFSLRESDIFVIRGRRPGGVLLTRKEAAAELTPSEPIIVVYPSASPEIAPLPIAAMQTLTEGDQFIEFENFVERPLTVNGLNSYEIIADAKEASMAIPVRILLMVVRASDRDMIIEAIVEPTNWDQYVPEFHSIAESLQITPAGRGR